MNEILNLMNIIEDNKQSFSDKNYLEICNLLQNIYYKNKIQEDLIHFLHYRGTEILNQIQNLKNTILNIEIPKLNNFIKNKVHYRLNNYKSFGKINYKEEKITNEYIKDSQNYLINTKNFSKHYILNEYYHEQILMQQELKKLCYNVNNGDSLFSELNYIEYLIQNLL